MANPKILQLSETSFDAEIKNSALPVLVDFWAEWCGPCRMLAPLLDELADEYEGRLKIAKVNVDDNQVLASKYGIRSIPTLLLFKDGQVRAQMIGLVSKKELEKNLAATLG